jgi:hypothetical protein
MKTEKTYNTKLPELEFDYLLAAEPLEDEPWISDLGLSGNVIASKVTTEAPALLHKVVGY